MEEISNKTLATLLVVAIVISLAGTFFAMRGTSVVSKTISGYQTADGTARVNITETISLTLSQPTVDFGEGYRNTTDITVEKLCNLTTQAAKPTCWYNVSAYDPNDFELYNSGNVYLNVTINSSLATTFLDGTPATGAPAQKWTWTGQHDTGDDGCIDANLTVTETDFNNAEQQICARLVSEDATDSMNVSIKLYIPQGITGNKSATVTFTGRVVS